MDLTDPDDVKVTVADPDGEVLVHLGGSDFAERFKIYKAHVQEWRSQFQKLDSVDLRYDNQVIVDPDSQGVAKPVQPKIRASVGRLPRPDRRRRNLRRTRKHNRRRSIKSRSENGVVKLSKNS